jgi:hypothetical protein
MKEDDLPLSFQDFLRGMSPSAFKVLGVNELAYIKANNGNDNYNVCGADGQILATYKTKQRALNATEENDLKAVTVH